MTPKEKAKELANKFLRTYKVSLYPPFTKASDEAKQCALIAVDEIIIALNYHQWQNTKEIDYFIEVRKEIEKL